MLSGQRVEDGAEPIRLQEDDPALFLFVNSLSILAHLAQSRAVDPDWIRAYWQEALEVVGDTFATKKVDIVLYGEFPLLNRTRL